MRFHSTHLRDFLLLNKNLGVKRQCVAHGEGMAKEAHERNVHALRCRRRSTCAAPVRKEVSKDPLSAPHRVLHLRSTRSLL